MENNYEIRYLPSFFEELNGIIYHITYRLKNRQAAERLHSSIIKAIEDRSDNPESFEVYMGQNSKKYKWYRIYVNNYTIFYVVRNNTMEIARIV